MGSAVKTAPREGDPALDKGEVEFSTVATAATTLLALRGLMSLCSAQTSNSLITPRDEDAAAKVLTDVAKNAVDYTTGYESCQIP